MDRRAFLCDAGAVALGAAWQTHALRVALGARAPGASAALHLADGVVFDPALARGRVLAQKAAYAGCVAWALADHGGAMTDDDIGNLWHARIARRLEPGAALIGALRPSDRFVLERLASARGVKFRNAD
ncbi:hypothetical protein [Paraburkholderia acidiphila]|uniref:Uncharacterized protein n=1 Tax=Paraburkholderia acidiphila TaxID=2571747 RepID=A0A7Z2J8R4_9BURK|nr:hypothetical protein [Paraburkholderia acidiphila]QGZ54893.1 hypothetical protein FAZ97_08145 [Paraburkholderia acidiphila]